MLPGVGYALEGIQKESFDQSWGRKEDRFLLSSFSREDILLRGLESVVIHISRTRWMFRGQMKGMSILVCSQHIYLFELQALTAKRD
jgi:hypothetical protein